MGYINVEQFGIIWLGKIVRVSSRTPAGAGGARSAAGPAVLIRIGFRVFKARFELRGAMSCVPQSGHLGRTEQLVQPTLATWVERVGLFV